MPRTRQAADDALAQLTTPPRDPRVYYSRDRLLYHLRQICPEELSHFPHASTFVIWRSVCDDPNSPSQEYRSLEIGQVWPTSAAQEAEGTVPQRLFVIDRGAYDSELPELVPYTEHGDSQRFIVEANGFTPTGIFDNFCQVLGNQIVNPRLDDPMIMSLIQFIFMLRDVRRYYAYTAPHDDDVRIHLASLIQALHVVTARSRLAARTLQPPWAGSARPGVPYLQGTMNHTREMMDPQQGQMGPPRGTMDPRMDPRLAAKSCSLTSTERRTIHNTFTSINRQENGDVAANRARMSAFNRFHLVPAHGVMTSEASGNSTMTEVAVSDESTPDESTPGGNGHSSSTSPPSDDGDDNL